MKMFRWFVALLICTSATDAQEIGEVSTVELTGGTATVALDFTAKDYELILFPLVTGEEDTARTFSYTVSGTSVSAKPALRRLPASTGHHGSGRIKAILREEERVLAERIRKRGGWRPSMGKVAQPEQVGSQRTFTYSNFVNSGEDRTVQATLVATSTRAVAYLDDATSDTVKITTADIQGMMDTFSNVSYPVVTQTFGEGSDVDSDGKVLFLFTQLVDAEPFIAGFYRSSSLFTEAEGGDGNVADMMFIGLDSSLDFYTTLLAHEFQHLVNYNQHVLVNNGGREESWLNEGLSHYAEDLVDGHVDGGMSRLYSRLLESPEIYSLTGPPKTSSGVRGAAYLFVRGLVKEFGEGVATQLVQTSLSGIANVEQVTGRSFEELVSTHATRLFLSGTGLNSGEKYTYSFPFFTEPTTGQRSFPMPFETGFSANGTPVTGQVKPVAPAYLRMMGEGSNVSVDIETEIAGNFRAILIPIPQNFRPERSLKGDYFPGVTFNAPIEGQYTSGEAVRVSGSLLDQSLDRILWRFQTTGEHPDTIRFYSDVRAGGFDRRIIFHPTHAGTYDLEIFSGKRDEGLDFQGRFSEVVVAAGNTAVRLPADYFSGFTLDTPFEVDNTSGDPFRFSGSVSDGSITQLSLNLTPLERPDEKVQFSLRVDEGKFDRTLVMHPSQAGQYELELFAGLVGESKPLVDGFSPFTVVEGSGSVSLPSGFFDLVTLDSPIPTTNSSDDGIPLKGSVSDPTINQLFLRLTPLETGKDTLEFFTDVVEGVFSRSFAVHPSKAGVYELELFSGQRGESKPLSGGFAPFTITQGVDEFILPQDFLPGFTFDPALAGTLPSGESVRFSGTVSDPSVTQVLLRFEPLSGVGDSLRLFIDIDNGQFDHAEIFGEDQEGEYKLVFFSGLQGESLSFVDSFLPISIVEGSGEVALPTDYFPGIVLDGTLSGSVESGEGISLVGGVDDASVTQLLFRFDPPDGAGEAIRFFTTVTGGRFARSIVFTPAQAGEYILNVFAGPKGESLSFTRALSPFKVTAGSTPVMLPVDYFEALALDGPLPIDYFVGQSVQIAGAVTDQFTTQILFRFDPLIEGAEQIRFWTDVSSGRFDQTFTFTAEQTGDYTLNLFGGLAGEGLPFWDSYTPVRIASGPRLVVRQQQVVFGEVSLGQSGTATVVLVNQGNELLSLTQVSTDNAQFGMSLDPFSLAGGDSVTVAITFTPSGTGAATGILMVNSNDPMVSTVQIALSGTGSEATQVLEPEMTLSTSSLDFGSVAVGASAVKSLVIVNSGTATLKVDNVSGASDPFTTSLVTITPVFVIAPGDSTNVQVSFEPGSAGDFTGALTLTGNVPDVVVTLSGTATSDTTDTGKVGDFNGDGQVAFSDFILFAGAFGTKPGESRYDAKFDLNENQDIGFKDFLIFAQNYGK